MANCGKEIALTREGTDQNRRFIEALDPGSVKLNDFSLKEWMQFAYRFGSHLNYFSTLDFKEPAGTWENFFIEDSQLDEFLQKLGDEKNITPHLALFISFVWLLGYSQKRFNRLTKRHLDFYYQNILQIEKLPPEPDKVHVLFELAKKSTEELIPEGTELDGGKDAGGQKRVYKTTEDLVANQTKVTQLKSVYHDHQNNKIKAANTANSYDGKGADFPDDDIQWWPFGYYEQEVSETGKKREYPELDDATIGFAVSSHVLQLQEGERNIRISVGFKDSVPEISTLTLTDNLEIWITGEKEWLGPFDVQSEITDGNGGIYSSGMNVASKKLTLAFQIPKDENPVVDYDPEIHEHNFEAGLPVCRVLVKTGNIAGHKLYSGLVEKEVENLSIDVDVRGVKNLVLENDTGLLNAEKPFFPFGTRPVKRSNFYIGYPELFSKNWDKLDVEIDWKNTPEKTDSKDAFVELYYAYRDNYIYQASSSKYLGGIFLPKEEVSFSIQSGKKGSNQDVSRMVEYGILNPDPKNLIVKSNNHFRADVEIRYKEEWENKKVLTLFNEDDGDFKAEFSVENEGYEAGKNGPVRLSLNQSFLHDLFPRIYALAFSSEDEDALIPNEPYTPMVESISLNYSASASMSPGVGENSYRNNEVKLFHEHPFGQAEEHPWLKSRLGFFEEDEHTAFLLPLYSNGGELYIGLENAKTLQQVSLLAEVIEGSENPDPGSFDGNPKTEWSILVRNQWMPLNSDYMIANNTDNFLKSGIVKFSIPKEANTGNTVLDSGLVWVKAKIHKNYDAVCKAVAIHAQAVTARFADNNNELSHLEKGLEADSISKLVQRVASVKGIEQPYASLGGKPGESDAAYYRRVSERLRHKNRAITIWDYENLILQHFPKIHKVKCLNHTSGSSFLSPGDVYLVVIPDIVNNNVFDIYQPRVSKALLNEIGAFVNSLNSLHVNAVVANPDYEEVTVKLKVKFRKGYDENFYLKKLNEDIIRLLSPWAFSDSANIKFGTTLHRSTVIHYIEKLKYVDYVEDVKLKKGSDSLTRVSPDSPKSILVSARQHNVKLVDSSCPVPAETTEKE